MGANTCTYDRARVRPMVPVRTRAGGAVITQRLFIGVPCAGPAPELDAYLGALAAPQWRMVPRAQRHWTLAFLGPQPDEVVAPLITALDSGLERQAAFRLDLAGLGAFPSGRRPTSLWVGCTSGQDRLEPLSQAVRDAVRAAGLAVDPRPLRPHVTVARRRAHAEPAVAARGGEAWIQGGEGRSWGRVEVSQVVLWRSDLEPTGARYTPLRIWPLAGRPEVP